MKEQAALFSYEDLGIDPESFREEQATVTEIRHSHYGLSWVHLDYKGQQTFVVLDTQELDIDQANDACAAVPEWWSPSVNRFCIYAALQGF